MKEKTVLVCEEPPETASYIEDGIRPLVIALSGWPHLKTISSCEGHPEVIGVEKPFVAFFIDYGYSGKTLKRMRGIIKGTGWLLYRNRKTTFEDGTTWTLLPQPRRKSWIPIEELAEKLNLYQSPMRFGSKLFSKEWISSIAKPCGRKKYKSGKIKAIFPHY